MRSQFDNVTNGVDFSVVRKVISAHGKRTICPKNSALLFFLANLNTGSTWVSI